MNADTAVSVNVSATQATDRNVFTIYSSDAGGSTTADTRATKRRRVTDVAAEATCLRDELYDLQEARMGEMHDQLERLIRKCDEQDVEIRKLRDTQTKQQGEIKHLHSTARGHGDAGPIKSESEDDVDTDHVVKLEQSDEEIALDQIKEQSSEDEVQHLRRHIESVKKDCNDKEKRLQEQNTLIAQLRRRQVELEAESMRLQKPSTASIDRDRRSQHNDGVISPSASLDALTPTTSMPPSGGLLAPYSPTSSPEPLLAQQPPKKPHAVSQADIVRADATLAMLGVTVHLVKDVTIAGKLLTCANSTLPPRVKVSVAAVLSDALRALITLGPQTVPQVSDADMARVSSSYKCIAARSRAAHASWVEGRTFKLTCRACYNARTACLAVLEDRSIAVLPLPPSLRAESAVPGEDAFYIADGEGFRERGLEDGPWDPCKAKASVAQPRE